MRKWLVIGMICLLAPWAATLVWMEVSGAEADASGARRDVSGDFWDVAEDWTDGSGIRRDVSGALGDVTESWKDALGAAAEEVMETGTGAQKEKELTAGAGNEGEPLAGSGEKERRILVVRDGISTYMALEDYLPGVVVCQILPGCTMEALKCQAVIARTYICRLMDGRDEIHEEELDLDYLGAEDKGIFFDKERRETLILELERCGQAVKETKGVAMQADGRYILPLFHRMSAGRTRKGEEDFPFLQPVESVWDTKKADFLTVKEMTAQEFADCIRKLPESGDFSLKEAAGQIQVVAKDGSGYVEQIKIGAKVYSGEEVQYALGLPSSCYTLETGNAGGNGIFSTEKLRIVTKGSGHGYGLSQTGADAMAEEGWRYGDILHYYYKNISLITE